MVGLPREGVRHLDIWGRGVQEEGLPENVTSFIETRKSTRVCKWESGEGIEEQDVPGKGSRLYRAETPESSASGNRTALKGPAGPQGCGYYL